MKNGRKQWKDLPLTKRMEVYNTYMEVLYKYEGYTMPFEQVDACWREAWVENIIPVFGVRENIEYHYQNLMKARA